jgi:hypothetical protein
MRLRLNVEPWLLAEHICPSGQVFVCLRVCHSWSLRQEALHGANNLDS